MDLIAHEKEMHGHMTLKHVSLPHALLVYMSSDAFFSSGAHGSVNVHGSYQMTYHSHSHVVVLVGVWSKPRAPRSSLHKIA